MKLFQEEKLALIGKKLIEKNQTISVAESVTSGLLQYALASIENASQFYQGGLTAYNLGQKYKHLSVEPIHALKVNCVSEKVVEQMAVEVTGLFNSDWGIGISGYASRVAESGDRLYAYYAIAHDRKIIECCELISEKAHPPDVQIEYVNAVIDRFNKLLKSQDP